MYYKIAITTKFGRFKSLLKINNNQSLYLHEINLVDIKRKENY